MLGGMSQGQAKIAPASAHGGMSVPSLSNEMSLAFPITRNALFILRVIQSSSRGSHVIRLMIQRCRFQTFL